MPTAAVIVAHPDDETLWCGGLILKRPNWDWFILTLCRGSDSDRAARFEKVLTYLGAQGTMADLDDGAEQEPLDQSAVRHVIREGLPRCAYDFVFTHGPGGEYTRHRRHEECSRAVVSLWTRGQLEIGKLMLFAYDDLNGTALPRARTNADELHNLDHDTLSRKHHIIVNLYGFDEQSWEGRTIPAIEGFWDIDTPGKVDRLRASKLQQDIDEFSATLPQIESNGSLGLPRPFSTSV